MLAALHKSRRRIRIEVDVDTMCGPAPKPPFMRLFDLPSSPSRTQVTAPVGMRPLGLRSIAVEQVEAGAESRTRLAIARANAPAAASVVFGQKRPRHRAGCAEDSARLSIPGE